LNTNSHPTRIKLWKFHLPVPSELTQILFPAAGVYLKDRTVQDAVLSATELRQSDPWVYNTVHQLAGPLAGKLMVATE